MIFARRQAHVPLVRSGSNAALDMFPKPKIEGGLAAWKAKPLGAAWDTEERRADVLSLTPEGKIEKVCERTQSQPRVSAWA